MTDIDIIGKVEGVFRDVFDESELKISETTTAEDIEDWDSLAHISLVVAIEKEFNIKFALDELQTLQNVGEMVALINKKISPK